MFLRTKELLQGKKGQTDLLLRDGAFYLSCAVTVAEAEPFTPEGVIGIDLGIVNVATDSEGNRYTGEPVKKVRKSTAACARNFKPRKPARLGSGWQRAVKKNPALSAM